MTKILNKLCHLLSKRHGNFPNRSQLIGKSLLVALLMLMVTFNSSYSQELFWKALPENSLEFAGSYLNPRVFERLQVKSDQTGAYVQIDDMRFRTDQIRTYGYKGLTWFEGLFVYEFAPGVKNYHRDLFVQVCKDLSSRASLKCVERAKAQADRRKNYVYINNDSERNYSFVGMVGGKQSMGIKHWKRGVIMHEILHALGWVHEQNRSDRYQYVKINWKKIEPGKEDNFEIDTNAATFSAYDFGSIMHYPTDAFLADGMSGKTIEALPKYSEMEKLMGSTTLSKTDARALAHEYGKPGSKWCRYDPRENTNCDCTSYGWCCDGDHFCCSPGNVQENKKIKC